MMKKIEDEIQKVVDAILKIAVIRKTVDVIKKYGIWFSIVGFSVVWTDTLIKIRKPSLWKEKEFFNRWPSLLGNMFGSFFLFVFFPWCGWATLHALLPKWDIVLRIIGFAIFYFAGVMMTRRLLKWRKKAML